MWRDLNITKQDWERTPAAVRTVLLSLQQQGRLLLIRCTAYEKEIAALRQQATQIDDLKAEMAELRERLRQNSQNSSKPPSSNPSSQRTKSTSEPTGRKRGGQFGHPGHGRQLKPKEEVDQIVELRPISCAQCGHLLLGDDPQPARHQVSEVPRAKAEVTEYRRHTLTCVVCGASTQAEWPEEMPPGAFGPRAQAVIGYLKPIQQQVKELLQAGSCSTHPKTRHTCQNILKLWESLWTFVRVEGVEPTNNNAERPLRRAVIWLRKSFGTQSESGSRFVERILTVVTTLRQQGRDVLGYLTTVCTVASVSASSPCLLPDSS